MYFITIFKRLPHLRHMKKDMMHGSVVTRMLRAFIAGHWDLSDFYVILYIVYTVNFAKKI